MQGPDYGYVENNSVLIEEDEYSDIFVPLNTSLPPPHTHTLPYPHHRVSLSPKMEYEMEELRKQHWIRMG